MANLDIWIQPYGNAIFVGHKSPVLAVDCDLVESLGRHT